MSNSAPLSTHVSNAILDMKRAYKCTPVQSIMYVAIGTVIVDDKSAHFSPRLP